MNQIKRKLRSRRGASITFALLIFLVCSMVSIAVVVAGSAAAGRMSQRAETDQRYYAVTSAVELLCDDFKGKTVTVVYEKGDLASISAQSVDNNAILEEVSKTLVRKIASEPESSATLSPDDIFSLTTDGPANSALDCTIKAYVHKDGRVTFEVSNTNTDDSTKVYTLQTTFEANISESVSQYEDPSSSEPTVKQRVTTKLTWSLNSVRKGKVGTA